MLISRETMEGIEITGKIISNASYLQCLCFNFNPTVTSFCELAPKLVSNSSRYLLSEVFSQDPIERYFSKQRHRGGGNENPTVEQFRINSAILMQQQQISHDLKTMNVQADKNAEVTLPIDEPLPKRPRKRMQT